MVGMLEYATLDIQEKDLALLAQKIERERDFDCSQFRQAYFRRRVLCRLRATGAHDTTRYMALLDTDAGEWARLLSALTVNVTGFFRDRPMWDHLRLHVAPALIDSKRKRGQSYLRIWSAGCSSGQEAYSLAMLFAGLLEGDDDSIKVRITATDFDRDCLAKGRRGRYTRDEAGGLTRGHLVAYAKAVPEGIQLSPQIMSMVRFQHDDLFGPGGQRMMDMALCRNVMMYFSRDQQKQVLCKLRDSLNPGGFLVLGKSEKLATSFQADFDYVSLGERIYRKRRLEEAG